MLDIDQVSKTYRRGGREPVTAAHKISLQIQAGEFVAVRGPSGCGKTTLLLMAGGLLAPDDGTVKIAGQDPYALAPNGRAQFRAHHIGFVFQQFHLVPYLNVFDNIRAPAVASGLKQPDDRARELISHFGLKHRIGHVPAELSTGERQRTALARALLNQPKLLLADEPTGNLDRDNAETVLKHLTEFVEKGGAVLLVTHEDHALTFAHRTLHLRDGQAVTEPATKK